MSYPDGMSLQDQVAWGYISMSNNYDSWFSICNGFCEILKIALQCKDNNSTVCLIPLPGSTLTKPVTITRNPSVLTLEFLRKMMVTVTTHKYAMIHVFTLDNGDDYWQIFNLQRSTYLRNEPEYAIIRDKDLQYHAIKNFRCIYTGNDFFAVMKKLPQTIYYPDSLTLAPITNITYNGRSL